MLFDLRQDRATLRDYILQRIKDYSPESNLGPGESDSPIKLITLGYYAAQGGYANLVFDTRPDAEVDGEWTVHIDNEQNTCEFPHWKEACETVYEGEAVSVIRHDGRPMTLHGETDDEQLQAVFGEMLVDLLTDLRKDGALAQLPLAEDAFMVIEEFDGLFFWPTDDTRESEGRVNQ